MDSSTDNYWNRKPPSLLCRHKTSCTIWSYCELLLLALVQRSRRVRTLCRFERALLRCVSPILWPKEVSQLCDIRFQNQELLEGVIQLENIRFSASATAASWTLTCHRESTEPTCSCKFCIITLACGCGIHAPTFVIPRPISSCNDTHSISTHLHSVNFDVLHAFHDSPQLNEISGTTMFSLPPRVALPSFVFESANWTDVFTKDKQFSIGFKRLAKSPSTRPTYSIHRWSN